MAAVDHIEDRSQDFVHSLHVFYLRIQPSEDEEYPGHVVIAIGDSFLL